MIAVLIVLMLGGFMWGGEQPVCRTEASAFTDVRCATPQQRARLAESVPPGKVWRD